ncbi:hypothetical protein ACKC9G_13250 [Pokkaliibacter sp. CJK22405]|uniref:hypothetical protein n=1 Tax=Pokkaliibacter sp. CJK22405 TaxID=3384615 RepID=UPI003984DAAF
MTIFLRTLLRFISFGLGLALLMTFLYQVLAVLVFGEQPMPEARDARLYFIVMPVFGSLTLYYAIRGPEDAMKSRMFKAARRRH